MIQFDLRIFSNGWFNHQTSANCNAFEIMSSTMQCSSATVFLVPFHWVSPLWRYVSPNLPGGEVSHPVHHACIGAGGPLLYIFSRFKLNVGNQRCGHAFVGCGPPPQDASVPISSRNPSENCQHLGCLEPHPPFFFRLWNERCHDLNSMEIRTVKDACFLKLVSFYIVIMVPNYRYIQNTTTWWTIDTPSNVLIDKRNIRIYLDIDVFIYTRIYFFVCRLYCIYTWLGLYTESFVTFSEDMPFFFLFYSHGSLRLFAGSQYDSAEGGMSFESWRVCGNWVGNTTCF